MRGGMMLAGLALTLIVAAADEPARPRRGDRVRLSAAYGQVPALDSEAAYKAFLAAVKADDRGAIRRSYRKTLHLAKPGEEVEVVEAAAGEMPAFPGLVPAIVVRRGDRTAWIPAIYAHPGRDAYPVEAKFPVLIPAFRMAEGANPGEEMALKSRDGRDVPVAVDYRSYRAMEKAVEGKDKVGMAQLVEDRSVIMVAPESRVLVVGNINDSSRVTFVASEVRFIDGPHKDRLAWSMDNNLAAPDLIVTTRREMARAKKR